MRVQGGTGTTVRNLTINGSQLTQCSNNISGIVFSRASGTIGNINVSRVCGTGIAVESSDIAAPSVAITDVSIANVSVNGIRVDGDVSATISESQPGSIFVNSGAEATITDCEADVIGVFDPGTNATIEDNAIAGSVVVSQGASAAIRDNTITGPGGGQEQRVGILFGPNATGEVEGNTIANFSDGDAGVTSCGILVEQNAGAVDIGANTFPGVGVADANEQNVCDFS